MKHTLLRDTTVRQRSMLVGMAALFFVAGASFAQTTPPDTAQSSSAQGLDEGIEEITVTGTRIRGVAPVGSALVSLDQDVMENSGLTSTNDILNTVPAVLNIGVGNHKTGGINVAQGFSNSNSPNIHGLGTQATLSLANGHRMWGSGTLSNVFDPNLYPSAMIGRIEVVADGGSAIYGADAVAGTVNYILREPEKAFEVYLGGNWSKGHDYSKATAVVGHTWDEGGPHSGGFIMGFEYYSDDPLYASEYPDLYNNDFSPYGGAPSSTFSSPGNILVNNVPYAIPFGQNGETLTLSDLGPAGSANRWNLYSGIGRFPGTMISQSDDGVKWVVNFNQKINDRVELFGDGLVADAEWIYNSSGSINQVATDVPNSNPYSPCNPDHYAGGVVTGPTELVDACATGSLRVNYNTLGDVGGQFRRDIDRGWAGSVGAHIALPGDWQITPMASLNEHYQWYERYRFTAPDPNAYNFFCDSTQFDCLIPGGIDVIIPPPLFTIDAGPIRSSGRFYTLAADGPVFEMPGGTARLALGVERNWWEAVKRTSTVTQPTRSDNAAYAELYLPFIGRDNARSGIQGLELNVSYRYDDYTDTGSTTNPKIGVNWWPNSTVKVHASYGTSFRPAPIQNLGSLAPRWTTSTVPASGIDPALCPLCTDPSLNGTFGSNKLVYSQAMGNHNNLVPEESESYSLGFEYNTSDSVAGLQIGVNYWWIEFVNQVGNPESNAGPLGAVNSQLFNDHMIYNPTFFPELALNNPLAYYELEPLANLDDPNCALVYQQHVTTQELYDAWVACANNPEGGQSISGAQSDDPNDIPYFTYFGQVNAGSTEGSGFDISASVPWSNGLGDWSAGFAGTLITKWDVSIIPGAPIEDKIGKYGYMLRFNSRVRLNWQREFSFGSLSGNLFVNYKDSQKMDLSLLPNGVDEKYANIDSFITTDISLVYNTGSAPRSSWAKDVTVIFSAQNALDTEPPSAVNGTIQFDPAYGWPPSRVLQLQLSKQWW